MRSTHTTHTSPIADNLGLSFTRLTTLYLLPRLTRNARAPTSPRSIGFCAIWESISSSSSSALLDLLHFTFFLDCPLSQASYKAKSFQRRIALVRLPLLPGQYVTSFTNKTRPELELTYGPRPLTGTALRAAPRWCVVCIPQQNGEPTRRAVKNFAVQGCTAPPPTHTPLIKRHAHSGQGAVHTDFLVSSGLMSGEEQDESLSEKPSEKERESEDAGHDPS